MFQVKYLPLAEKDLTEIIEYFINENSSGKVANNFLDQLDQSLNRLKCFPHLGCVYDSNFKLEHEYRMIRVKRYLVIYLIKDDLIEIQRIIYEKRSVRDLLR